MYPSRGNKGDVVQANFTAWERESALREFYTQYKGGNHLQQFEDELQEAKNMGKWE